MPALSRSPTRDLEGFILAGGRSSRFGSDKALAIWNERPLLAHAMATLRELGVTPRVVCREPASYLDHARLFVMSERSELGPLEGLRVALRSASASHVIVLSTDMPLVRENFLRKLLDPQAPDTAALFISDDGIRHPFPGVYPRSALPVVESLPAGSSVQALLDRIPLRALATDPDIASALRGVNTPEDLRAL